VVVKLWQLEQMDGVITKILVARGGFHVGFPL
jgi:hypothetical protein